MYLFILLAQYYYMCNLIYYFQVIWKTLYRDSASNHGTLKILQKQAKSNDSLE